MTVPARISCIVARKAPVVAVFRRGPSKRVALLEWTLATNPVAPGQWLKGRIGCGLRASATPPDGVTPAMTEDAVTYVLGLKRDGRAQGPDGPGVVAMRFARQAVHARDLGERVMVADLNGMRFRAIDAFCAGAGPGDLRAVG
jgi:hypothetical protein